MTETETVTLRLDDVANLLTMSSVSDWDPTKHPEFAESFHRAAAVKDAAMAGQPAPSQEPGIPPGEYAMIELPGYVDHVGWLTDGTRAGQPVIVVSDRDGKKLAEVSPGAYRRIVPLQVPERPDPLPGLPDATMALPAADAYEGYYPGDEHEGPADAFAGRTEPDAPF
jgi:hypothetical protein